MPSNQTLTRILKAALAFALSFVTLLFLYIGMRTTWISMIDGNIKLSGVLVGAGSSIIALLVFIFLAADALKNIKGK